MISPVCSSFGASCQSKKIIVLLGPPGAGKGTIAQLFENHFGFPRLSTGDLFRKHMAEGTSLGVQIAFAMNSGKLVADELVIAVVNDWLASSTSGSPGVLLDGYPRTISQAAGLVDLLKNNALLDSLHVIRLSVSDELAAERIGRRLVCTNSNCQAVYALSFSGEELSVCIKCQTAVGRRADDAPETVRGRLSTYHSHENGLVEFYRKAGLGVRELNAEGSLEAVFAAFVGLVGLHDTAQR